MEKYDVKGMSCAACSARVEKAVSNVDGVSSCAVNLLTNSMVVDGTASSEAIIKAVENAGYGASIHKDIDNNTKKKTAFKDEQTIALLKRLISSLVFLLILMYFTMGHMMFSWPLPQFLLHSPINIAVIELVLTCVIMVINRHFFISGFKAIFHKAPNMDTLVAMGSAIGFLWSLYEFILIAIAQANGNSMEAHELLMNLYFESSVYDFVTNSKNTCVDVNEDTIEVDMVQLLQFDVLFIMELRNNELSKTMNNIKKLIDNKSVMAEYDRHSILESFINTNIAGGITLNSVHFEILLMNQIRSIDDDLDMPDWSRRNEPYKMIPLSKALSNNRSITVRLEASNISKALLNPNNDDVYRASISDLYFMEQPQEF